MICRKISLLLLPFKVEIGWDENGEDDRVSPSCSLSTINLHKWFFHTLRGPCRMPFLGFRNYLYNAHELVYSECFAVVRCISWLRKIFRLPSSSSSSFSGREWNDSTRTHIKWIDKWSPAIESWTLRKDFQKEQQESRALPPGSPTTPGELQQ